MAKPKSKTNIKWTLTIFLVTFIVSMTFSYLSIIIMDNISLGIAILMLLFIILLGVVNDLIAVAVTAANIDSLHAKASDKKKGAKTAIRLVKSANKVSSICADVVGDVSGILSGSVGVLIAMQISNTYNFSLSIVSLVTGGVIAALTVTGKSLEKHYGINKADEIVYFVGRVLEFYKK